MSHFGYSASITSIQPGSVTPSQNGEILIAGVAFNVSNTPTVGSGFSTPDTVNYTSGTNEGISMSYLIQTTASAVNPLWSWSSGAKAATAITTYKAAASPGSATCTVAALGAGPC